MPGSEPLAPKFSINLKLKAQLQLIVSMTSLLLSPLYLPWCVNVAFPCTCFQSFYSRLHDVSEQEMPDDVIFKTDFDCF